MPGCVAFSVYCYTGSADKCNIRLSGVLESALDLGAAALCIEWRMGVGYVGLIQCKVCEERRWVIEYGLCLGRRRSGMQGGC